jgi:glycosyltransferase involved in cell wall biosynthesis
MTPSPTDLPHAATPRRRRVAVVIPVYNHEQYVEAAIASVLGQTQPPDRVVVVDDGSRDRSVAAVERALANAGSIAVEFRTQANRGTARTLNETISRLDEEVVGILNSDDLWMPDRLERMLPEVDPSRPSIAFSGVEFFGDADQPDLETYPRWMAQAFDFGRCFPTVGFSLLLSNIATSTGNFLFSRELHEAVGGFDEAMPICHDWQFLLDALRVTEPAFVPEALYRYRIHGTNTYREHADPSGREMRLLQHAYLGWATAPAENPLAPTPRNFPRWMPFFVPLWLRRVAPGCHAVPQHAMRLAPRWRDSDEAMPTAIERESIAAAMARIRSQADPPQEPSLEAGRLAAAARWTSVKRRMAHSPPRLQPRAMHAPHAAHFSWAGASTTVAAHDPRTLRDLAELTGLEPMPAEIRLGRAEINALPECQVFVHDQWRRYRTDEDRLIWMALTVGELLARHAACPLLHAASIEIEGKVALLCGPPFAGKSTATLRAIARGLSVLGDDQVRVAEGQPLVQALPRPVKLRVDLDAPLPEGVRESDRPVRGMLEDEATLMLRRGPAVSPDRWLPIAAVFHLSREGRADCRLASLEPSSAREMLRSQLRGPDADDPVALDATHSGLLDVPQFGLVVGDRRTDEALDLVERTLRESADKDWPVA